MGSITRKAGAWVVGTALTVAGCTAVAVLATPDGGRAAAAGAVTSAASTDSTVMVSTAATVTSLHVVSVRPANGARDVNGAGSITVAYSQPLPAGAPLPALSPVIAGSWQRTGDLAVFRPARGYAPGTRVTVTVAAAGGGSARAKPSSAFTTGRYSTLRLQQVLAQLGYLPLTWTPATGTAAPARRAGAQLSAAYAPPKGAFHWQRGYPAQLHSFWSPGRANTITRGAVSGFEADHKLPVNGTASPAVWQALLPAVTADRKNSHGYSYAIASKRQPETLTIWHNGRRVFSSLANTGIPAAPTALGTYPVYEKLPFQVMRGTNPDGSHYSDPVSWVSYFNGGDAVHYFSRGSYGFPQSLGCVELPYAASKRAYPYLPYGTLVTVTG